MPHGSPKLNAEENVAEENKVQQPREHGMEHKNRRTRECLGKGQENVEGNAKEKAKET